MQPSQQPDTAASGLHFLDYWRIIRMRKFYILFTFIIVVGATAVFTRWMPKQYEATVRLITQKDVTDVAPMTGQTQNQGFDPFFLETEALRLTSQAILLPVIEEMKLNEVWAKRYGYPSPMSMTAAYEDLKNRRMDVRQIRNTSYIEISVFSEDTNEVAQVANRIAQVYKESRISEQREKAQKGVQKFKDDLVTQDQKIQDAQKELDRLRKELQISDVVSDGFMRGSTTIEPETLRRFEAMRTTAMAEYVALKTKLESLKSKTRKELRQALPTAHPDQDLALLIQKYNLTEQELATQKQDLTEDNPTLQRTVAALQQVDQQIESMIDGIMLGLETKLQEYAAMVESITEQVEQAKEKDLVAQQRNRPYYNAKQNLENLQRIRYELAVRIQQIEIDMELGRTDVVQITDKAQPPRFPVRPRLLLNLALGTILGLGAGLGLAFFVEYLDTSVKTIDDMERLLGVPVLSVIPQNVGSLLETDGEESPHAEAYRVLQTNLDFSRSGPEQKTLVVVSAGAGEGKSTTAIHLALVLARAGSKVLLVDADLRRPTLHRHLNMQNTPGLTDLLLGRQDLAELKRDTPQEGLTFLPSGRLPSSAMGLLGSRKMKEFLAEAKAAYDWVIIDSPPVMGVSDASVLISQADLAMLVVQYRKYPQAMTVRARQTVEKVGGRLAGVVLNNINIAQDAYYYYYSGFEYGYSNRNEPETEGEVPGKKSGSSKEPGLSSKY